MPTATLLIEIVIIGLFANLNWFLLIFFHTPQEWKLIEWLQSTALKEGVATLILFSMALSAYVVGVIVNVIVNNLFDPIDDHIRENVFNKQIQNELKDIDPWIDRANRKVNEIYHYMRYRLYSYGESMKEQLDQHRSEIRILRATALNSYWLMVVLLYRPLSHTGARVYLAGLLLPILISITTMALLTAWRLPFLRPHFIERSEEESKERVSQFYQFCFRFAICFAWAVALGIQLWFLPRVTWGILWWLVGPGLAGLVAFGSYMLWKKQQKRFYEALFHGFRALAIHRELGRVPAKGVS